MAEVKKLGDELSEAKDKLSEKAALIVAVEHESKSTEKKTRELQEHSKALIRKRKSLVPLIPP